MSTSTWVLLLFCTFLSKMSSSFLNVLQIIICVMLMIKFLNFFYCKWWVPEQTQEHHLVLLGLMLVSLCALLLLFSLHWLWHYATLRSNWAIKPLTSMLYQESGRTQRFSLFGRSSSEPEELPSCHSDTAVSEQRLLWWHIYATDIHAR